MEDRDRCLAFDLALVLPRREHQDAQGDYARDQQHQGREPVDDERDAEGDGPVADPQREWAGVVRRPHEHGREDDDAGEGADRDDALQDGAAGDDQGEGRAEDGQHHRDGNEVRHSLTTSSPVSEKVDSS